MLDIYHENDRILLFQSQFGIWRVRDGVNLLDYFGGEICAFPLKSLGKKRQSLRAESKMAPVLCQVNSGFVSVNNFRESVVNKIDDRVVLPK